MWLFKKKVTCLRTNPRTCLSACPYTYPYTCPYTCLYAQPQVHTHADISVHMSMHMAMCTCLYTRHHTCLCACLYAHAYTHVSAACLDTCLRALPASRGSRPFFPLKEGHSLCASIRADGAQALVRRECNLARARAQICVRGDASGQACELWLAMGPSYDDTCRSEVYMEIGVLPLEQGGGC